MPDGIGSVTTSAPVTIEASALRFTAMFFGPSAAAEETDKSIRALVEATDEILPPNVGEPKTSAGLDAVMATSGVMSSPPIVNVLLVPLAARIPKLGRVKLSPVAL